MQEIWADVVGFEEFYEVSNFGRVRSKERRYINEHGRLITKHSKDLKEFGTDYKRVGLKLPNDTKVHKKLVHILVAKAFIPNPDDKPTVNHIDGDKGNNCVQNLEWATYAEQIAHAVKNNLRDPYKIAELAKMANSKAILAINMISDQVLEFKSIKEARIQLGMNEGVINYALKHGNEINGWYFEYKV